MIVLFIILFAVDSEGTLNELIDVSQLSPDMLATQGSLLTELSQSNEENAVPASCYWDISNNTNVTLGDCCQLPPLFYDKKLRSCRLDVIKAKRRNTQFKRSDEEAYCSHLLCVLNRLNLLNTYKNTIDEKKFYNFLNDLAKQHPAFRNAVNLVKNKCIKNDSFELLACSSKYLFACMVTTIAFECPIGWHGKPECFSLKQSLRMCGSSIMKSSKYISK
ncbi:uncharacterized protein LOC113229819 [Hyposmocoma kahamanoa]|uniref:uncharacterized protein LOC113229819 n=1 Tax=Hyposmocoma kahamanoa TaxID=1477025 RepID=UPI000E6D680D|nr:uncharacterized protein LOC113229819 [Hyposmocoma kahamanoa]